MTEERYRKRKSGICDAYRADGDSEPIASMTVTSVKTLASAKNAEGKDALRLLDHTLEQSTRNGK